MDQVLWCRAQDLETGGKSAEILDYGPAVPVDLTRTRGTPGGLS
jgi:hypothetical protein